MNNITVDDLRWVALFDHRVENVTPEGCIVCGCGTTLNATVDWLDHAAGFAAAENALEAHFDQPSPYACHKYADDHERARLWRLRRTRIAAIHAREAEAAVGRG